MGAGMDRLLIVDDNIQNIYLLETILKSAGNEVISARNGKEALELIRKKPPDMIVSDILMPIMDGFELCRQLKADKTLALIPFIFYTATYTDLKDEQFALGLGADRFVIKPQKPEVILQIINEVMESHRQKDTKISFSSKQNDEEIMRQYNEVLFRKLEKKVMELENEIGNRIKIEERLRMSEEHYRMVADYTFDWEYWISPEEKLIYSSPSCERITGYTAGEFVLNPELLYEIIHPDDVDKFDRHKSVSDDQIKSKEIHQDDFRIVRKDGSIRWIGHICRPVFRSDGAYLGKRSSNRDITKRKNTELALKESDSRLEKAMATGKISWWELVFPSGKVNFNVRKAEMIGFHPEVFTHYTDFTKLLHPDDYEKTMMAMKNHIEGRADKYQAEYRIRNRMGEYIWFRDIGEITKRDENAGEIIITGVVIDITERKSAEEALKRKEQQLTLIYNTVGDVIFQLQVEYPDQFRFILVNQEFLKVTGLEMNQVVGKNVNEVIPEPSLTLVLEKYRQVVRNKETVRWEEISDYPSGRLIGEVKVSPVLDDSGQCVQLIGSVHDITERKKDEEKILESEEKFRNFFENSPIAKSITGIDGSLQVNRSFCEMLGYSIEELSLKKFTEITHPDDIKVNTDSFQALLERKKRRDRFEKRYIRKDGDIVWADVSVYLQRDKKGTPQFFIVTANNITERKRAEEELAQYRNHLEDLVSIRTAELKKSEENLKQARDLAEEASKSKTVFLSSMSHEIRTPLNAVLGFSQLMLRDMQLNEKQREWIGTINRSGEHLLALINDILEISKIESGRTTISPDIFDLPGFLDDLEKMFLARVCEKNLSLEIIRDKKLPQFIEIDGNKLRQIFINLVGNSIKFTDVGKITVNVFQKRDKDGKSLLIADIKDTGAGIPHEDIKKIFETFEQTKLGVKSGGTGLGLSISRRFALLMGGDITVKSEYGKGSCFHLEVRFMESEGKGKTQTPEGNYVSGLEKGQEQYRIMIVDDELANRTLLMELLGNMGFVVFEAANGMEAVEKFRQNPPDLIFLDIGLPGMDGFEVVKKIKTIEKGPHIPVIAVTASAFIEDKKEILKAGVDGYIKKPYKVNEIFDVLRSFLGVRFVYEDVDTEKTVTLKPISLSSIPDNMANKILEAAQRLDIDKLLELINEIENNSPEAAAYLKNLAKIYHYDELIKILQEGRS
jgi:PAS domain S-box-containing protein